MQSHTVISLGFLDLFLDLSGTLFIFRILFLDLLQPLPVFFSGLKLFPVIFTSQWQKRGFVAIAGSIRSKVSFGTLENSVNGVIIFGGYRVKFVIMATGTADCQPHEGSRCDVDLFINNVSIKLLGVPLIQGLRPQGEKTCGDDVVLGCFLIIGCQEIACNLFTDELIKRFILIECLNHIIPVTPGLGVGAIAFHSGRFSISGYIQPMTSPAFSKM